MSPFTRVSDTTHAAASSGDGPAARRGGVSRAAPGSAGLVAAVLALLLIVPFPLSAHQYLVGSTPANDFEIAAAPREVRLVFSERAQLAFTRVELIGPGGTALRLSELRGVAGSPNVVIATIEDPVPAGGYIISWRSAGADGHAVRGSISFLVLPASQEAAPADSSVMAAPPAHHDVEAFPAGHPFDAGSPAYVVVRWLLFAGLLGVLGVLAFRLLVVPLVGRGNTTAGHEIVEPTAAGAARVGVVAAGLVLIAAAARLFAQSYALHGGAEAIDPEALLTIMFGSVWGWAWVLQVMAAALAMVGFVAASRTSRWGWLVSATAGVALAFTPALSGHAVGTPELTALAVVSDTLHVVAAGGWVGSLLVVLLVGVPAAARLDPGHRGHAVAALINAFSTTALVFAGLVVGTGLIAAWLHVGAVEALWTTSYGFTLLVKLGILSALFGTGAYNFLRVRPALGTDDATRRLRRSSAIEVAVAVIILLATAVLVAVPTPRDPAPGLEADRIGTVPAELVRHGH